MPAPFSAPLEDMMRPGAPEVLAAGQALVAHRKRRWTNHTGSTDK